MAKFNDISIGQMEACVNRMGGMEKFQRFIAGSGEIVFNSNLTFVREVTLHAQHISCTSKEYWETAGVAWANEDFKAQFGDGFLLDDTLDATYVVRKLEQKSLDAPIIAELGGKEKAESSVAHFNDSLSQHRKSSEWFIFYLRGKDGNLWAVDAGWSAGDGGWHVRAYSTSGPDGWGAGDQVVSRK